MIKNLLIVCASFCALFGTQKALAQNDTLSNSPETLHEPSSPSTKSQDTHSKVSKKTTGSGNVLDFEGEVIEGERRRPDLFLQMSIDNVKFDSLIYQRDDFNDYLEVDRKSRTRYLKLK